MVRKNEKSEVGRFFVQKSVNITWTRENYHLCRTKEDRLYEVTNGSIDDRKSESVYNKGYSSERF